MKAALAHECNHNVRYQFIQWDHTVNLGELIVIEGLAENFATFMFGEEWLGPWITKTNAETLNRRIKPVLREQLQLTGVDQFAPYLYGDEIAELQNFKPVNMPYSAGYACGYYIIQYYLRKTGKTIFDATITPAAQILDEVKGFWVKDIVQITGITARTLHYYDRIDLFKPTHLTKKGYRLYDRSSLEKLQTILFLGELDFSLKEIEDI